MERQEDVRAEEVKSSHGWSAQSRRVKAECWTRHTHTHTATLALKCAFRSNEWLAECFKKIHVLKENFIWFSCRNRENKTSRQNATYAVLLKPVCWSRLASWSGQVWRVLCISQPLMLEDQLKPAKSSKPSKTFFLFLNNYIFVSETERERI